MPVAQDQVAQTGLPTPEEVEQEVRRRWAAVNAGDVDELMRDGEGVGFGWRTVAPRSSQWTSATPQDLSAQQTEALREPIRRFFESMEYYGCEIDEVHTAVDGPVGLAWGVHTERFKLRGRSAEEARVRFTSVLKKEGTQWRCLLYHREIQPFGPDGRYLPQFTVNAL